MRRKKERRMERNRGGGPTTFAFVGLFTSTERAISSHVISNTPQIRSKVCTREECSFASSSMFSFQKHK